MITKSSQVIRDHEAAAELANVLKFTSITENTISTLWEAKPFG